MARGTKRFLTNIRVYLLIEAEEESAMIQRLNSISIIQWAKFWIRANSLMLSLLTQITDKNLLLS